MVGVFINTTEFRLNLKFGAIKNNTIMKLNYLEQPDYIPLAYLPKSPNERDFMVMENMWVTLSDGYELLIEKGFVTDLSSAPQWTWSAFPPFDKALIGELIHDKLYDSKLIQIQRFGGSIYEARKFADEERNRWREALAPEKDFKNQTTDLIVKKLGLKYYIKKTKIPK